MNEKHGHESGQQNHPHEDDHDDCCGHGHKHEHADEHGEHKAAPESIALNPDAKGNLETTLRVAGMDCADEVEALERVFRPLKGVREVRVNLMGGKVTLFHDESVTPEQLIGAVASTGMKAAREGDDAADLEGAKRMRQISVAVSGAFTGLGLLALLTFSPCEGFLPVYVSGVRYGWSGFFLLTLILSVATVAGMIIFTWLTLAGIEKLNLKFLEQYESGVLGGMLVLLGLIVMVFEH